MKLSPFKALALGGSIALALVSLVALTGNKYVGNFWGDGSNLTNVTAGSIAPVNNFFSTNIFSTNAYITNIYATTIITTNLTVNDSITVQTNVTINQNLSVKGNATFNNITVTNQLQFTTNAFPLAAGTRWNLTKPKQFITTNADWVIGALGGLTNNVDNWGVIVWSNSAAATHFCDMTALAVTLIGPNSTNKLYIAAGKMAVLSIDCWGVGVFTNLVTAAGQ